MIVYVKDVLIVYFVYYILYDLVYNFKINFGQKDRRVFGYIRV